MSQPIVDIFRFWKEPTAPFAYLGAMWTIECKPAATGEHWECATTAPLKMVLAMAENAAALKHELFESGMAAVRHTRRWYFFQHLETLGLVTRLGEPYTGSGWRLEVKPINVGTTRASVYGSSVTIEPSGP